VGGLRTAQRFPIIQVIDAILASSAISRLRQTED
jgi:hypothetical protein